MAILHIDFETASGVDLTSRGLDNYAKDPSTEVHCMAYALDDEPAYTWAWEARGLLADVFAHVSGGGLVYAHNAAFELAIWNNVMVPRYHWPALRPEQVRCTMAMAYAMALPGSLEQLAPALGIDARKDMTGHRIMLQLCKPRADRRLWEPEDAPEKFAKLYDYCKQDVEVERAVYKRLVELSPNEQKLWVLDQEINGRGVQVDLRAAKAAESLVECEKNRLNSKMLQATSGVVAKCTEVARIVDWARTQGVDLTGLAKADVNEVLDDEALPESVRAALELRQEAAKSSTAKLTAMLDRASKDGRVRGIHQYHGAGTGRWAGRGIQLQNFPRPRKGMTEACFEDAIAHFSNIDYIDIFYGPPMAAVADCLRSLIVAAPGHELIASDFSAIEARVLPWLAGAQHVLDVFEQGEDIYKFEAARIYGIEPEKVSDAQRQIGKVAVLALGYGGGKGAFQMMAKAYNVKVSDDLAEDIKLRWRAANPEIVKFWYALESEAVHAATHPGVVTNCRGVLFKKAGSFLWCKLPSGRKLCYPYPEIRAVTTPWDEEKDALTYMTVVSNPKAKRVPDPYAAGQWQRISTYGGSLAENVTQAVARDLLAEALLRLEAAGKKTVFHVHDEAVIEVPETAPTSELDEINRLMTQLPAWAAGLPVDAKAWRGKRYRK